MGCIEPGVLGLGRQSLARPLAKGLGKIRTLQ